MKTESSILTAYAVTPCHAGSGSSIGVVDLPIQRERHTNWPVVASSGVKGAMRSHVDSRRSILEKELGSEKSQRAVEYIFGSEKNEYAGAISVTDLKMLAYPMRSNIAPFVWITCPAVLKRLVRDLQLVGKPVPSLSQLSVLTKEEDALWLCGSFSPNKKILLEDMEVECKSEIKLDNILQYFKGADKLLIVHDTVFDYGVSHCTSINAQIKIDQATGTTQSGSLRYQEELPSDTILYSLVFWGDSHDKDREMKTDAIKSLVTDKILKDFVQIGGDETCGRGIFQITWN